MTSFCYLFIFLLSCLAGSEGANKNLGEACATGDTCVGSSPVAVCDATAAKCLAKVGQTCAHFSTCVTGAACNSGICKCGTAYTNSTPVATCEIGATKAGGACGPSSACATGSTCNTGSKCACDDGYVVNPATGACDEIPDAKIGAGCTATTAGDQGDCGTNANCPGTTGFCQCDPGYTGTVGGDCNIATGKVGAACSASAGAQGSCGTNAHCTGTSVCQCDDGYTGPVAGDCDIAQGKISASCSASAGTQGDCGTNAHCSGTSGVCQCDDGYNGPEAGDCGAIPTGKIGAACTATTAGDQGNCGTNANCPGATGFCQCNSGYTGTVGGDCATIPTGKIGAACTATSAGDKGNCGTNANCPGTTGFCQCDSGYTGTAGGDCSLPIIPVAAVCAVDVDLYKGYDNCCWMAGTAFYFTFLLPLCLVLAFNTVIYTMVVVKIWRLPGSRVRSRSSTVNTNIVNLRASVGSFVILGLSWTLALLAVGQAGVVIDYLFTISTSLQGLCIFPLFVARDPAVRAYWTQRYRDFSSFFASRSTDMYETRNDTLSDPDNEGIVMLHFNKRDLDD